MRILRKPSPPDCFNWFLSYCFLTEPLIWEFQLVIQCNSVFIVQAWLVKHNWGYNKGTGEQEGRANVSCLVYTEAALHTHKTGDKNINCKRYKKFLAENTWFSNRFVTEVGWVIVSDRGSRRARQGESAWKGRIILLGVFQWANNLLPSLSQLSNTHIICCDPASCPCKQAGSLGKRNFGKI